MILKIGYDVLNQDEEMKNEQLKATKGKDVSDIFQLDIESSSHDNMEMVHDEGKEKWAEIKSKIKVNPDLDQEKTNQLWELLDQFLDVFAWHKGKLGCYKIREHIVHTQRFPPCKPTPN
jgi:hypothetical protein